MSLKMVFAGSPELAVPTLNALIASEHNVVAVYTQPDRRGGRGRKQFIKSPVKIAAEAYDLPIEQPESLKTTESQQQLFSYNADVFIVLGYGIILPESVLNHFPLGGINPHVSLLPKYRGASPMQEALKHGDKMTGVTVQDMVFKMDQGDILAQEEFDIGDDDTLYEVYTRASNIGAALLPKVLHEDFLGNVTPIPQSIEGVSYCTKITKQDGFVDLEEDSAEEIYNKYRAYKMWPGVWTMAHGKRLKLTELAMESSQGLEPGRLQILRVQPEGKKEMGYEDYLRGV